MPPINQNPDQSWLHTYQLQMLFEQSALAPLRGGIEAQQEFMIDMILMGEAVTSAANMRCGPASLCRPSLTDIVGDAFLFAWERTNPLELARQELAQMGYQEASQYQNLQMEHERIVAAVSAAAGNDVNYIAAVEAEQRAFLRRQEALTQQRQAELVRELASNDAVAQSWEQFYRQVEQRIRDELNANQVRLINDEFRSLDNESDRLNRLLN
ncbi:MAG: hypothetical protein KC519_10245 [Anaerolineae bacterium]|nr:hypothetical protein [Anaerolineae bacterium]